nr:GTPase [Nostoc sp. ZfuVER08]
MTNDILEIWIKQLLDCFRTIADGSNIDLIEEVWHQYKAFSEPVVTIYGPWNAGKSSLLKRLLIDDGKNVPEWLTVKANPTTFKNDEISALECIFRDTPGISNERIEHETKATEALILSDAFLLVLLPQLITAAEKEQIIPLLTGKFFGTEINKHFLLGSLKLVICRMDEGAGIDPAEDEQAYRKYVRRKQEELQQLLEKNHVDTKLLEIHAVAADAYGSVGDNQQPYREDYDHSREWDGMDKLTEALKNLPSQLPELRQKTALRYFSFKGKQQLQTLSEKESQTRAAIKECDNWVEQLSLLEKELNTLIVAAEADIKTKIGDELRSLSSIGYTNVSQIAPVLKERLIKVYIEWQANQNLELKKLVKKVETELSTMSSRPAAQMLSELLEGITEKKSPQSSNNLWENFLDLDPQTVLFTGGGLAGTLKTILESEKSDFERRWHSIFEDLKPEEVKKELDKLTNFSNDFNSYHSGGGKLTQEQINQAPGLLQEEHNFHYHELEGEIVIVSIIVLELGLLYWVNEQKKKTQKEIADRRAKVIEQVTNVANIIADEYFNTWKKGADSFTDKLKTKRQVYMQDKQQLNDRVNILNKLAEELKQILNNAPV